jgi:EAL domain-containing protein (putative c-di-GMP-specific phosphodiesterase class I)
MTPLLIDLLREPGAIRVEFQPIVRLHDGETSLYALEALSRGPQGTSLERAEVMFEYVRRKGVEAEVDLLCMAAALHESQLLAGEPRLALNVHGLTLSQPTFAETLLQLAADVGVEPRRLVLEIVEHRTHWAMDSFAASIERLRASGVGVAVDDFGAAAANFRMLVDCRPDHVKVDRYLVHGCSGDRFRAGVLRSITSLASDCSVVPIAEGVEDAADLELLREVGIEHFQGWLWAPSMVAKALVTSGWLPAAAASRAIPKEENR